MPIGIYIRTKPFGFQKGQISPFKGKHHSEKTKIKISLSKKGIKLLEKTKKKISLALKGIKRPPFTEEHIKHLKESHKGKSSGMLGKKHTKITKRKISEKMKGRKRPPLSEEWKRKISERLKGRNLRGKGWHHTIKTRKKLILSHIGNKNALGHKHTLESRKKMSISRLGGLNPKWITDRDFLIRNERNDPEYKQWVLKVKKRDNNICKLKDKNCFGYNIVHHIKNWSLYPELRYEINNGITLCQFHHPRKKDDEKRLIPILQKLVGSNEKFWQNKKDLVLTGKR